MYNIRHTNHIIIKSNEPYISKQYSYLTMNSKIKGTCNTMLDECDGTNIYAVSNSMVVNTRDNFIINDLVVVSQTERKATLVVFGHGFSILNVDSTETIDLHNGVISAYLNGCSLIKIGFNSLISTSQHHNFVIATYDVSKHKKNPTIYTY